MSKKIILTESQEKQLIKYIIMEKTYPINPDKVLQVKEYLDKKFKRGNLEEFVSNGLPSNTPVVGMLLNNKVVKNLTASQLLDILEDEFRGMFNDKVQTRHFLKQVMVDWYYKRISKEGLLSTTNC
jgi:hypothetical protein